jgi:hypothetical protein
MVAPAQQLVINKVAEEGIVGASGFAHEIPKETLVSMILQHVS